MTSPPFTVETIHLDLAALAGAFSRRLREAGVPITAERAAHFAHALALVRPITRRRLYWTARAVMVSDPSQLKAFDAVFLSVFGASEPEALSRQTSVRLTHQRCRAEKHSPCGARCGAKLRNSPRRIGLHPTRQ